MQPFACVKVVCGETQEQAVGVVVIKHAVAGIHEGLARVIVQGAYIAALARNGVHLI